MIINEILEILDCKYESHLGILLNSLYDEFRGGRDRRDVLMLLSSDDHQMRYFGCDILNETAINDETVEEIIVTKLYDILRNDTENNMIRAYHALFGIYLDNDDKNGLISFCEELKNHCVKEISSSAEEFIEDQENKSQPEIIFEISKILSYTNKHHMEVLLDHLYWKYQFGRNPEEILILLNSNSQMVDFGCRFANAINVEDKNLQQEIIDKLSDIIEESKSNYQRGKAFEAICRFYREDEDLEKLLLLCNKLKEDKNKNIKITSEKFIDDPYSEE